MLRLLWIGLLLPGLALAQPSLSPPSFSFDLQAPTGPVRYAAKEVATVRFLGEAIPGPTLQVGDRVELLAEKDGWIRFKKGDRYAWAPSEALSETAPAADPE